MKTDIRNHDDVKILVNTFYGNIRANNLLGPIFEERIKDNWQPHLEKMYKFWDSILFGAATYSGKPFPPHATMNIGQEHFSVWLELFKKTVDELFEGENANEAKHRADKIAEVFVYKIEYLKNNPKGNSML